MPWGAVIGAAGAIGGALISSGDQQSTSTYAPPPKFQAAYNQTLDRANTVAGQPYQPYTGEVIAGFTPAQMEAFNSINASKGVSSPYLNAASKGTASVASNPISGQVPTLSRNAAGTLASSAANTYTQAAPNFLQGAATSLPYFLQMMGMDPSGGYQLPNAINTSAPGTPGFGYNPSTIADVTGGQVPGVDAASIGSFMDPYTQQVVDATQSHFNNQNEIQRQKLIGNAISSGAFGGDRAGVAQAELSGQQNSAQAPIIADLYSKGYGQALTAAQQQQQVAMQKLGLGLQAGQLDLGYDQATNDEILRRYGLETGFGLQQQGQLGQLGLGQGTLRSQTGLGTLGQVMTGLQSQDAATLARASGAQGAYNANASNALGAASATSNEKLAAAQQQANLGTTALNNQLKQAEAQLQAGTQQQQLAQNQLNAAYQQYAQSTAYPMEMAQWLANVTTQLGGVAGGVGVQSTPVGNPVSGAIGGALTANALATSLGSFQAPRATYDPSTGNYTPGPGGFASGGTVDRSARHQERRDERRMEGPENGRFSHWSGLRGRLTHNGPAAPTGTGDLGSPPPAQIQPPPPMPGSPQAIPGFADLGFSYAPGPFNASNVMASAPAAPAADVIPPLPISSGTPGTLSTMPTSNYKLPTMATPPNLYGPGGTPPPPPTPGMTAAYDAPPNGPGNNTPLQDIAQALALGLPVSARSWASAGFGPGGIPLGGTPSVGTTPANAVITPFGREAGGRIKLADGGGYSVTSLGDIFNSARSESDYGGYPGGDMGGSWNQGGFAGITEDPNKMAMLLAGLGMLGGESQAAGPNIAQGGMMALQYLQGERGRKDVLEEKKAERGFRERTVAASERNAQLDADRLQAQIQRWEDEDLAKLQEGVDRSLESGRTRDLERERLHQTAMGNIEDRELRRQENESQQAYRDRMAAVAEANAGAGRFSFVGVNQEGLPLFLNADTGQTTTGNEKIGAKPSVRAGGAGTTLMQNAQFLVDSGVAKDAADAVQQLRSSVNNPTARLRLIQSEKTRIQRASMDLMGRSTLSEAELQTQAEDNVRQMQQTIDGPAAPGAPAPSGGEEVLPERAKAMLSEGVPFTFANGQTWSLEGGVPKRLK